MVQERESTEWKYTIQTSWDFFSADAGKTWSVTAPPGLFPNTPFLLVLTKPSYQNAEKVIAALNRIYFPVNAGQQVPPK